MHFSRNVTYIPAAAFFVNDDDNICEGRITYGKQISIPPQYLIENQKKKATQKPSQSSSTNSPKYDIEMVSSKAFREGGRKIDSGKRVHNPITRIMFAPYYPPANEGENPFAPYYPSPKKQTAPTPKKPEMERPSQRPKIIFSRKDDSIAAQR